MTADTTTTTSEPAAAATATSAGTFIPPSTPPAATPATVAAQHQASQAAASTPPATPPATQVEDPDAAGSKQSVLNDLAQERDKRQATEAKLDAVLAALNMKPEQADDPVKIAADLAATLAENAVLREGQGIADVEALLDSRSFLATLGTVDVKPGAMRAHIEAFVATNPRYAPTGQPAPVPGVRDAGAGAQQATTGGTGDWLRDSLRKR